ncbi:hypothetical protein [Fulvitalea axinellae]
MQIFFILAQAQRFYRGGFEAETEPTAKLVKNRIENIGIMRTLSKLFNIFLLIVIGFVALKVLIYLLGLIFGAMGAIFKILLYLVMGVIVVRFAAKKGWIKI